MKKTAVRSYIAFFICPAFPVVAYSRTRVRMKFPEPEAKVVEPRFERYPHSWQLMVSLWALIGDNLRQLIQLRFNPDRGNNMTSTQRLWDDPSLCGPRI